MSSRTTPELCPRAARPRPTILALLPILAVAAEPVRAADFALPNGWEGRASLDLSVGAAMRAHSADAQLISKGNGGAADGGSADDGDRNYAKGDVYSLIGKAVAEFQLKKDDYGVFARGKGWYDYAANHNGVDYGHSPTAYRTGETLRDGDFLHMSKFDGVELLDAYAFADFDLPGNKPLSLKLGNHVVNWGESIFIPGVNQYNAFDYSAARRPGTQVKEILLPVPQVSANLGLGDGLSVEGFYQLAWKSSAFEGCGTYWGPTDILNCSDGDVVLAPSGYSDLSGYRGIPALGGLNARLSNAGDSKPGSSGQFGVATRYYAAPIGTEFGAYYSQYNQRMPVFSMVRKQSTVPNSFYGLANSAGQYFSDWSAERIKVYGLSATTELGGWTMSGELSRSEGVPVQINTSDLVKGVVSGQGPLASLHNLPLGSVIHGYDRKDKNQIQLSAIKSFPNVLGADSAGVIGEVAYQHWNGIGDPATSTRYGRSPTFGMASSATSSCSTINADYCAADGFATPDSWGLRAQFSLTYNDVLAGMNLIPRLFLAWDVEGYSPDGTFIEDRQNLGLGLRAELNKTYYADLNYSTYNHQAKYDPQRDRDFVSLVFGMTF